MQEPAATEVCDCTDHQHKFISSSRYAYMQLLYHFNYQFNKMHKINIMMAFS